MIDDINFIASTMNLFVVNDIGSILALHMLYQHEPKLKSFICLGE